MHYKRFEWNAHASSRIQWAAFYINSAHMFEKMLSGYQAVLVYSLYLTTQPRITTPPFGTTIDPTKYHLYEKCINRFRVEHFMPNGESEA